MDNAPRVLAGRYEVGELIGRGGMAEVHIGHDARLGRTVAIKILRSDLARDPSFLARFRREAQAAASLNHPAIVAVYDTGEDVHTDTQGASVHVPFIVMEYVEGHTVREILRDGQAVPIDEAIEITAGVLAALEYSHHAGIVHRDIKPANVMITPTGAVKVMDFGIARAVADSAATMTQTQAVIGTAQYLSPEQARGETVDARSDLYSTGCLLFELLTGRPPFVGDSPVAVAYQHVREAPATPSALAPDVPEVLDRITLKALAKERTARYGNAAEFRADLENALRGGLVNAPALGVAAAAAGLGMAAADAQPTAVESATQIMNPAAAVEPPSPWGATGVVTPPEVPVETGAEEAEDEKPKRRGLMWALITIGVLAIAAIVTMLLLNQDNKETPQVTVPTITQGLTTEAAKATIEAEGLKFEAVVDQESDLPPGTTTGRQSPEGETLVDEGTTVKVWVAGEPGTVNVPDVSGKSQEEARTILADNGLEVGDVVPEDSSTVPKGMVIRTDPGAGQTVTEGQIVGLVVASGNVQLPDLRGRTQADAEAAVKGLGLVPQSTERETADAEAGTVVEQSPRAGSVQQGSTVELVVAKAPTEPTPKPTAEQTRVPNNLRGMTQAEAEEALGAAGLNVGKRQMQSDPSIEAGDVIGSDPGGGTTVAVGTEVSLIVSTGPEGNGGNG